MEYKALVSFTGQVAMSKGQVKELTDKDAIASLLRAGYIEPVKPTRNQGGKKDADSGA